MKYFYVYRITNISLKKHYYGARSCNKHPKEDLGVCYFSSSSDKKFLKHQKQNKHLYKYKIVKIFKTFAEALEFESLLHKKFNVNVSEKFYNKAKQTSNSFSTEGTATVKDIFGNIFQVPLGYDKNEFKHQNIKPFELVDENDNVVEIFEHGYDECLEYLRKQKMPTGAFINTLRQNIRYKCSVVKYKQYHNWYIRFKGDETKREKQNEFKHRLSKEIILYENETKIEFISFNECIRYLRSLELPCSFSKIVKTLKTGIPVFGMKLKYKG